MFLWTHILYAQEVKHTLKIDNSVEYKINNKSQKPIKNSYSFEVFQSEFEANIEFLAYSPLGEADDNNLNGSDVALEEDGIFTSINDTVLQDNAIQGKKNIPLVPINFVKNGQLIFIRITDQQRNNNPNKIETVVATLQALTGNNFASASVSDNNLLTLHSKRVLRFYETGENTGVFIAYIPFHVVADNHHDMGIGNFTVVAGSNALISVSYREKNTGILKQDYLMVDVKIRPEGRVFNTLTGEYLDGLNISLIDAETGDLANVFASDGKTPFPATVTTGQDTVDMSGNNVDVGKGEYFFPYVPAGQYRLRIDNLLESLVFPSTVPLEELQTLAIPSLVIEKGGRGQVFQMMTASSVGLDLPVDVFGKINLTKTVTKNTVGAGEVIPYTLRLTNADNRPIKGLTLIDDPARELRYVGASLLVDGVPYRDFSIDEKTLRLSVTLPDLPPKTTMEIKYAMRVIPAISDSRILRNTAQAFGYGGFVSNLATADVMVTDDMLQTYGTVVGRVYFDGCSAEEKQKRDIVGLPNIRLFNQNGDQVLTDKDGKFSFSAVKTGLNVYQLDKVTLPEGVEVSLCKDNTRHAGTAFSQFVDVSGGYLYKVNFTLKGDKEKYRKIQEAIIAKENSVTNITPQQQQNQIDELPENSLIRQYDEKWLDTQKIEFKLIYPGENYHPGIRSLNFGVTYPSHYKVIPYMNDIPVSQLNKDSVIANAGDTLRLVHYRGVDLQRDSNILRLELRDKDGNLVKEIKHEIIFNQLIYNAELQKEKSLLRADGLTNPEIVLKLTDKQNVAIASGRPVRVDVSAPYSFMSGKNLANFEALNQENISGGTQNIAMGQEGLLTVKLNPTTQSGRVVLRIYLSENDYKEIEVWLESEKRDWILVGLADGSVAYNVINGNIDTAGMTSDKIDPDIGSDGKIAFYTKGMISSEWLMSLSFDNTRKKESEKMRLFRQIAPNQKFAVLGDLSTQSSDASSQYPLYLKLERDHFYALFGDYDTAITNSELMPYARRLSGFQTVYSGENFSVQAFAAEEGQDFFRDDIRLDGTSGPYKLNGMNIIQNSDRVFLETRKLSDPAIVLRSEPLSRYVDYDIDYQDGVITLRSNTLPYNITTEFAFLRVEFETYNGDAKGEPTYGSRVTTNF